MALGIILILFVSMSVISILGIGLLYLLQDEKKKRIVFYTLAVWGMLISVISATGQPTNWIHQQLIAWGFGFLSVIGILVHVKAKNDTSYNIARILVVLSVVLGILKLFVLY